MEDGRVDHKVWGKMSLSWIMGVKCGIKNKAIISGKRKLN